MRAEIALGAALTVLATSARSQIVNDELPFAAGFRGIWYANQPSEDEFHFKYSGGLATYPQQHVPIAYYVASVHKTFFTYGGAGERGLQYVVSYFDHTTGLLARPRVLLEKRTTDAHDNPVLMLDGSGFLWIFGNAHGTARPAFIFKSRAPHSIAAFDRVLETNFSYAQPWWVDGHGFCVLHTRYAKGRWLWVWRSPAGSSWPEPSPLARFGVGHYQVSWRHRTRVGTAFNYHPADPGEDGVRGLNARTNLYYVETLDGGARWQTAAGQELSLPLESKDNRALVHDYEAEDLLVYLKCVRYQRSGHPVLLYLTSRHHASGPLGDPRTLWTARWTGAAWQIRAVTRTDHNYDFGELHIDADGSWRLVAPTDPATNAYATGGEMALWRSADRGLHWRFVERITNASDYEHTYARRPVNADPHFYTLWADGHAHARSPSRLYFATRDGDVFRMPFDVRTPFAKPVARPRSGH